MTHTMFLQLRMAADELEKGGCRARTVFNPYPDSRNRSFPDPANLRQRPISLGANVISRRQIHQKQGVPSGTPDHQNYLEEQHEAYID